MREIRTSGGGLVRIALDIDGGMRCAECGSKDYSWVEGKRDLLRCSGCKRWRRVKRCFACGRQMFTECIVVAIEEAQYGWESYSAWHPNDSEVEQLGRKRFCSWGCVVVYAQKLDRGPGNPLFDRCGWSNVKDRLEVATEMFTVVTGEEVSWEGEGDQDQIKEAMQGLGGRVISRLGAKYQLATGSLYDIVGSLEELVAELRNREMDGHEDSSGH